MGTQPPFFDLEDQKSVCGGLHCIPTTVRENNNKPIRKGEWRDDCASTEAQDSRHVEGILWK